MKAFEKTIEALYLIGIIFIFLFVSSNIYVHGFIILLSIFLIAIMNIIKNNRAKINSYSLFLCIWFFWSLFTYFWSIDENLWLSNCIILGIALGYTIISDYYLSSIVNKNRLFKLIVIIGIIHLVISFFEMVTGLYFFTDNNVEMYRFLTEGWPVSFFYNPNDLSVFYTFLFIIILSVGEEFKFKLNFNGKIWQVFRPILLILLLLLTLIIDARISSAVMILSILLNYLIKADRKYFVVVNVSLFLLSVLGLLFLFTPILSGLLLSFFEADASTQTRVILIQIGLDLLKDSNFVGLGAGQYRAFIGQEIHNWWIENLVNYGVIFFVGYLIYYIKKLIGSYVLAFRTKNKSIIMCFIWLVIFIFASVASSTTFDKMWIWIANAIIYKVLHDYSYSNTNEK